MINYYYWFACFSYCDDDIISQNRCCNNILEKWDLVFHKEYGYENDFKELLLDLISEIFDSKKKDMDFVKLPFFVETFNKIFEQIGKVYSTLNG